MSNLSPENKGLFDRFGRRKHRPKDPGSASEANPAVQVIYDDLMKATFGPALRRAGLKGSGGRFDLPSERYWAQLGFQKSAYSDSAQLKFTVNLSVIDREVWKSQASSKPYLGDKPTPSTHYGHWADQVRIGQLMPNGEDHWWSLRRGEDATGVSDEVTSALTRFAVPWLVLKSADQS